jgi:hypothetical protein
VQPNAGLGCARHNTIARALTATQCKKGAVLTRLGRYEMALCRGARAYALGRRTTDAITHWRLASGGYRLASILQCRKERRRSDVPRRSGVVYGAGPRRRQSAADWQQGGPQSENGRDEAKLRLWATTACRYQAGPRLSSRAGWGKRRPSIRRRAWRNNLSTTRDCIIQSRSGHVAFYIG